MSATSIGACRFRDILGVFVCVIVGFLVVFSGFIALVQASVQGDTDALPACSLFVSTADACLEAVSSTLAATVLACCNRWLWTLCDASCCAIGQKLSCGMPTPSLIATSLYTGTIEGSCSMLASGIACDWLILVCFIIGIHIVIRGTILVVDTVSFHTFGDAV